MSINININVGDNKLLAQASAQQNASRQAQLDKEADKRLKSEAEINRVNALAAQGKDANGNSLVGTRYQVPSLERRPAANRDGDVFGIGHCWVRTKNPTVQTIYQRWIDFDTFRPAIDGFGSSGLSRVLEQEYGHIPQSNILCGNGSNGIDIALPITGYAEPIPGENSFAPSCTYTYPVNGDIFNVSTMQVLTGSAVGWGFGYFMMPVNKNTYVLVEQGVAIYGQSIGTHTFWNATTSTGTYLGPAGTDFGFPRYNAQSNNIGTCTVPTATGYAQHDIKTNYAFERRAFLCTNTSIREISMPAVLLDVLKAIYPDPTIISYGTNAFRSVTYQRNYYSLPSWAQNNSSFILSSSTLVSAGVGAIAYDPSIFDTLNFYLSYTSTIKPSPTGRQQRIADMSTGGYSIYSSGTYSPPFTGAQTALLYSNGNPLYYTNWPIADQAPDFRTFDSYWEDLDLPKPKTGKALLQFSASRPTQTYASGEGIALGICYDWNDPDYCRQQLLALGFSSSDLTP